MSYRSVKRVLGETRLELKCLVLFAVCLFTLIGGSFWWYGSRTETLVQEKARGTARSLANVDLLKVHWSWVKSEAELRAAGRTDAISSMIRSADVWTSQMLPKDYTASYLRLTDREPYSQLPTEDEAAIFQQFPSAISVDQKSADAASAGEALTQGSEIEPIDRVVPNEKGDYEYQYFQPVYATYSSCATCHDAYGPATLLSAAGLDAPSGMRVGDLIAVAKITMPDPTHRASNQNRAIFLATAVLTVFLAMIASYVIVRYVIVKPLKHLRDVSDEISRGNMEARAEIHTADEFEEVGVAFNKMVRHLVNTQDELKHTNAALDTKVDELAQTNMRLYEMNRLKSDFLATMSHELRTPLNSIIGFSEVLDSIKSLDDKQRRYVQNIQKSGRVLLDMINDILDLAKIESGKMDLRLSEFRIDGVVQAQCDFFRPQTERKNIDLDIDIEPDLPELFQDQAKVQQILSNLLSNAIKFTPEGGRIDVRARRELAAANGQADEAERHRDHDDGQLLLIISDTGVGIAEEDQVAIFEKFRQGQAVMAQGDAITREYSGTGLGLSIVKELCKLLGGEITLESQIGRGSTFTVHLPWSCPGHARVDAGDNLEEMLRPWRQEVQRTLDRAVPAAPVAER
jgi:two-component system, NarL family, sensor histidine kinase BarA